MLKLTPSGTLATGSINLPNANYISIDPAGNAWVTANNLIYELNNSGASVSGSPFSNAALSTGLASIVTDSSGVYVANPNAGVSLLTLNTPGNVVRLTTPSGVPTYNVYYNGVTNILFGGAVLNDIPTVSQLANGMPVSGAGTIWVSGDSLSCLLLTSVFCEGLQAQKINETTDFPGSLILSTPMWSTSNWVTTSSTVSYTCVGFLGLGGCSANETPGSVAVDNSGTGWIAIHGSNGGTDKLAQVMTGGAVKALLAGGGLSSPQGVTVDGAGNVFIANLGNASLTEYASTGFVSASTGFTGSSNGTTPSSLLNTPTNIDIDESGNLWVVNAAGSSGYVTEFLGIATPVARPYSYAVANSALGATP